MTAPTVIRCSSTDRALSCNPSLVPAEAAYNPSSPEANEGTAAHAAMAEIAMGRTPDLEAIAMEHGVDRDDLASIVGRAAYVWTDQMYAWFPEPDTEIQAEVELAPGLILRGTRDVGSVMARAVNDWKFGWAPSSHTTQVKSYSYLMRAKHGMPESGVILGIEYWVRPGELKVHRFDDAALDRLRDDLIEAHARRDDGQYGPSIGACQYCPRQNECAAKADWERSGVSALTTVEPGELVTREMVGDIYDRVAGLKKACARFDKLVKGMLLEGDIHLPDGRRVTNVTSEQTKIQPSKALAVLAALDFDAAQLDQAVKVTKSGLGKALKIYADDGQGAELVRQTMRALDDAGAVSRVSVTKKQTTKEPQS